MQAKSPYGQPSVKGKASALMFPVNSFGNTIQFQHYHILIFITSSHF